MMSDDPHRERIERHENILTELRIAVARIEERTRDVAVSVFRTWSGEEP